jgi:hypothetical protein
MPPVKAASFVSDHLQEKPVPARGESGPKSYRRGGGDISACISHTRACRNHTRECHNHTRECHNHTHTCQNHTLRVGITIVRV